MSTVKKSEPRQGGVMGSMAGAGLRRRAEPGVAHDVAAKDAPCSNAAWSPPTAAKAIVKQLQPLLGQITTPLLQRPSTADAHRAPRLQWQTGFVFQQPVPNTADTPQQLRDRQRAHRGEQDLHKLEQALSKHARHPDPTSRQALNDELAQARALSQRNTGRWGQATRLKFSVLQEDARGLLNFEALQQQQKQQQAELSLRHNAQLHSELVRSALSRGDARPNTVVLNKSTVLQTIDRLKRDTDPAYTHFKTDILATRSFASAGIDQATEWLTRQGDEADRQHEQTQKSLDVLHERVRLGQLQPRAALIEAHAIASSDAARFRELNQQRLDDADVRIGGLRAAQRSGRTASVVLATMATRDWRKGVAAGVAYDNVASAAQQTLSGGDAPPDSIASLGVKAAFGKRVNGDDALRAVLGTANTAGESAADAIGVTGTYAVANQLMTAAGVRPAIAFTYAAVVKHLAVDVPIQTSLARLNASLHPEHRGLTDAQRDEVVEDSRQNAARGTLWAALGGRAGTLALPPRQVLNTLPLKTVLVQGSANIGIDLARVEVVEPLIGGRAPTATERVDMWVASVANTAQNAAPHGVRPTQTIRNRAIGNGVASRPALVALSETPRAAPPSPEHFRKLPFFKQSSPGVALRDHNGHAVANGLGKEMLLTGRDASGREFQITRDYLNDPTVQRFLTSRGLIDPIVLDDGRVLNASRAKVNELLAMASRSKGDIFIKIAQRQDRQTSAVPGPSGNPTLATNRRPYYTYGETLLASLESQREFALVRAPGARVRDVPASKMGDLGEVSPTLIDPPGPPDPLSKAWWIAIGPPAPRRDGKLVQKTVGFPAGWLVPFHVHLRGDPPSPQDVLIQRNGLMANLNSLALTIDGGWVFGTDWSNPHDVGTRATPAPKDQPGVKSADTNATLHESVPHDAATHAWPDPRDRWSAEATQTIERLRDAGTTAPRALLKFAQESLFRELAAYYRSGIDPAFANRRAFEDEALQRRPGANTVVFLEVPGTLKPVNDWVGHVQADHVLREVMHIGADQLRQHADVTAYHLSALRFAFEGPPDATQAFAHAFSQRLAGARFGYVAGTTRYEQTGLPLVRHDTGGSNSSRRDLLFAGMDGLERKTEPLRTGVLPAQRGGHLQTLTTSPAATGNEHGAWLFEPDAATHTGAASNLETNTRSNRATERLGAPLLAALHARVDAFTHVSDVIDAIRSTVHQSFSTDRALGGHLGNQLAFDRALNERLHADTATWHGFVDVGGVGLTNTQVSRFAGDTVLEAVHATAAEVTRELNRRFKLQGTDAVEAYAVGGDEVRFMAGSKQNVERFARRFAAAMKDTHVGGFAGEEGSLPILAALSGIPVYVGTGRTIEAAEVASNLRKASDASRVPGRLPVGYQVRQLPLKGGTAMRPTVEGSLKESGAQRAP